jgi:hypothetical protein
MKDDLLKSAWQNMPAEKSLTPIREMLKENKHPVLKQMRRQLLFEGVAYLLFLFVYFDFFDGHEKPVYANILLVAAFVFALVNNVAGYRLANLRITGYNIRDLVNARISKLKVFVRVAISSRVLLATCLLIFFGSVITFTQSKVWILIGAVAIFSIQLIVLWRLWSARINRLKETGDYFNEDHNTDYE